MKFRVSMKDPDTLADAIDEAVREQLQTLGLSPEEQELLVEHRRESVDELCCRWFRYSEYLEVEIDTEAQTCTVVPVNKSGG